LAAVADTAQPVRGLRGDERAAVIIHLSAADLPSGTTDGDGGATAEPRSAERVTGGPSRPYAHVAGGPGLPDAVVQRLTCAGRIRTAANVGFDRQWTKATARACELVPAIAEHVQALSDDGRSRVHRRFRDDAVFGLADPDELRHVNLNGIAAES